ncbi:MAG TPA: tetratricopeptide repeat protein, partial [Streptosporangiaceae bacterium]
GAGGIGKTRLAIRVMSEAAADFPDGAWFVELADLHQPELVESRIASVVGVVEEPGRPLLATLADALRSRRALICLDTCEHLIDACARICQRLLASSPGLQVIATSREPLRVAAETVWQVPPMSMAPPGAGGAAAGAGGAGGAGAVSLLGSDALRLFADRAAAARPGFAITAANVAPVAEICRSLDGLPLAIELAAAWVRVLSVEQIAERLADRFRLLSSAERTAAPRHRTLRAAIDWSYDLLSEPERTLLRRLSPFAGWQLEMAEQVCAGLGPADDLAGRDVLDLLTALADKSLVIAEPDAQLTTRYRMLDTIREYAAERLAEAGESQTLQARFRDYGVREMEQAALVGMALVPGSWSARVGTFRRFEADTANIALILGRCLADGDAESGLRICASTRPVWIVQGSFAEGARWIDAFMSLGTASLPDSVLGPALVARAQLALATDPADAGQRAKAGLELCRAPGAEFWAASALNLLAEVTLHAGQLDEASAHAQEALAIARAAGDRFNEGYSFGTLGTLAAYGGDLREARRLGEAALAIARDIDQLWGAARALLGLGDLARVEGVPERARQHYLEALAILREVNARPETARCLSGLGRLAISQGDLPLAREYLRESIELSKSTGNRIGVIRGLDSFAALAVAAGDHGLAVRLTAAAAALRREAALPEAPASRIGRILEAAAGLGDHVVSELWADGSDLGRDAAIALALGPDGQQAAGAVTAQPFAPPGPSLPVTPPAPTVPGARLTARELEVATLLGQGLSNKAIAQQLAISPATAARHVANIMGKLGVSSRVQVAAWTVENARY